MTRKDLRALFSKLEAHSPESHGMQTTYNRVLDLVDIWSAPQIPVGMNMEGHHS